MFKLAKLSTAKSLKRLHYDDISQKDDINEQNDMSLIYNIQEETNLLVIFYQDYTQ